MRTARRSGQDGFIREVVWLAVIVAVIAVVLLDAMALFNAHQSSHDDAAAAVKEAQTEYAQSVNVAQAKLAAQQYLDKSGVKLVTFKATGVVDGSMGFAVTASTHAKTYAFKYLRYVPGCKDWVKRMANPVSTESSD
jgi:Tfp pilus assembly protein PilV